MSDSPARVAAEQRATRDREQAREILSLGIALFQKFDLLTVDIPVPDDVRAQLTDVGSRLRDLNLALASMIAHPPAARPQEHPSWPRLRDELHRLVRSARWLWAQETQVYDRLLGGGWSPVDGLDLVEALRRTERLAILFGYPVTSHQEHTS